MKRVISFCDAHGESAEVNATHTDVSICLDGKEVLLDLCEADWAKLTKALAPYIDAGRRPDSVERDSIGRKKRTVPDKKPCEYCGKPVCPGAGRGVHMKSLHPAEWNRELKQRQRELTHA